MTRAKFLNDLYRRLSVLTPEQAEQHLTYYAEMLADRMEEGMSEAEAVASMEPLDVIAQRILQDEGVPESPPQPPKYPDLPKTDGSRFTKVPDMSRKGIAKRAALVLLWVVAIAMAISAVGRWRTRHLSSDASETTAVDYGVAEDYAGDWEEYAEEWADYAEEWAEYAEAEWGEALYSDLADLWSIDVTPDGVFGSSFSLTPGLIFLQDGVHAAQLDADGADLGSARALDWVSLLPEGRYRYEDDIYRLDVGEAQSVNVKWNTGAVQIQGWDEEYIQFQEFSDTKLKQSQKLEYSVDGDMLNISKGAGLDKGLTVWVPTRLLDYLCVETSTADIYCGQLTADQGIVQATSGKIFVTNAAFSTLSVSASSGSADLGDHRRGHDQRRRLSERGCGGESVRVHQLRRHLRPCGGRQRQHGEQLREDHRQRGGSGGPAPGHVQRRRHGHPARRCPHALCGGGHHQRRCGPALAGGGGVCAAL